MALDRMIERPIVILNEEIKRPENESCTNQIVSRALWHGVLSYRNHLSSTSIFSNLGSK